MTISIQPTPADSMAAGALAAAGAAAKLRSALAHASPASGPELTQALPFVAETVGSLAMCVQHIAEADPATATMIREGDHHQLGPDFELQQAALTIGKAARELRGQQAWWRARIGPPAITSLEAGPGLLAEARTAADAAALLIGRIRDGRASGAVQGVLPPPGSILPQVSDAIVSLAWGTNSASLVAGGNRTARYLLKSAERSLWAGSGRLGRGQFEGGTPARRYWTTPAAGLMPEATKERATPNRQQSGQVRVPASPRTRAWPNRQLKQALQARHGGVLAARLAAVDFPGPVQVGPSVQPGRGGPAASRRGAANTASAARRTRPGRLR